MDVLIWPGLVLLIFIISVFRFGRAVDALLTRVRKVDTKWLGLSTAEAQEEQVKQTPDSDFGMPAKVPSGDSTSEPVKHPEELFQSSLVVEQVQHLQLQLATLRFENPEARELFLLKLVAASQISAYFEQIYRLIYGSQIFALHGLAGNNESTMTGVEDLRIMYRQGADRGLDLSSTSFESWLSFLEWTVLVSRDGDQVGITVRGKEFLKFLIDRGYSIVKAG